MNALLPEDSAARLDRWEGYSAQQLAQCWGVPQVHLFVRVGSTNDVARRLAEQGAPAGAVVLAEEQTAGRGRDRRAWFSPPRLGLWFSLVLRPAAVPNPGLLPIQVGLASATALDAFCKPRRPLLKWPNDIVLDGRKLGGVLCEATWEQTRINFVVAGIGLNVLHLVDDFPPELRAVATSVRLAAGWSPPREQVAAAVVQRVLDATREPATAAEWVEVLRERDALRGRELTVRRPSGERVHGRVEGIAADGCLRVRDSRGTLHDLRSGSVEIGGTGSTSAGLPR
jgi:BirA family transcriptional regulator, biotin operon repressor / biotin---[acetyl-CoA-carboxylase] ligase